MYFPRLSTIRATLLAAAVALPAYGAASAQQYSDVAVMDAGEHQSRLLGGAPARWVNDFIDANSLPRATTRENYSGGQWAKKQERIRHFTVSTGPCRVGSKPYIKSFGEAKVEVYYEAFQEPYFRDYDSWRNSSETRTVPFEMLIPVEYDLYNGRVTLRTLDEKIQITGTDWSKWVWIAWRRDIEKRAKAATPYRVDMDSESLPYFESNREAFDRGFLRAFDPC